MATKKKATKKESTAKTTAEATTQTQEQPQQTNNDALTLQDLIFVAQVFQAATQRGAIRPEEMEQVGAMYNKLIRFLQASGAIQTPEQAEENKDA